jgi:signal transduction histidine kinase
LTKPVREDDLERALELAIARFAEVQELNRLRIEAERRAGERETELQQMKELVRELRAAQLYLAGAARRAAVTGLANSYTHEINNALTPIIGNAQIIALLHGQDPETAERTGQIIEHARRIANWTAMFRQATAEGSREQVSYSFNGVARDMLELYAGRFEQSNIVAEADLDDRLPPLRGLPNEIQQALLLLLQNAIDALPGGGRISLVTRAEGGGRELAARLSYNKVESAAAEVPLECGDTSKNESVSGSLGWNLFTARQIVEAHGGTLQVTGSGVEAAAGATVWIRLPFAEPYNGNDA